MHLLNRIGATSFANVGTESCAAERPAADSDTPRLRPTIHITRFMSALPSTESNGSGTLPDGAPDASRVRGNPSNICPGTTSRLTVYATVGPMATIRRSPIHLRTGYGWPTVRSGGQKTRC